MRRLPLALLLALVLGSAAGAVVHTTGNGAGNTTPPPDDPGFANVGVSTNNLSGVYLGNGWVLTAEHVGEQGFTFAGVLYPAEPGSLVIIEKPSGTIADLALVHLTGLPPLPSVVLSSTSPKEGDVVTMIGNGWSREPDLTCWNASFVEIACPPPGPAAEFTGYQRSGARVLRWGVNAVTEVGMDVAMGGVLTRAFEVEFDTPGITHEAQSVTGDSGGAAFMKRAGTWELVGIQFAMAVFEGQPSNTAVFGDQSLMVDLYFYSDEIGDIVNAGPVPAAPWPALLVGAGILLAATRRALPRA